MGCTMREKHIRTNRRVRSAKPEFDPCCYASSISKSILESGLKPLAYHLGLQDSTHSNPIPNTSGNLDDNGWGYCTEEQLEEILLKNLEFLYKEAISKLVALGYDEDTSLNAILRNGHCYGGMVCLLQQVRPHLCKGDAMWCLLMSDLHVGRASTIEIPMSNSPVDGNNTVQSSVESVNSNGVDNGIGVVAPALCRFHGGWGFGNGGGSEFAVNGFFSYSGEMTLQKDIECPKRFNLSPSMKSLLKRNVAMFAAGFRANSKQMQTQSQVQSESCSGVLSGRHAALVATASEVLDDKGEESQNLKNQDGASTGWNKFQDGLFSELSKFGDLNLDENLELTGEDQKDEMIVTLLHQIKDLERQVKERKEWAQQKAMQAARKLSSDLTELKILKMEREETQRLKKGKQTLEDSTMKRLSEVENALRKASGQVDRANAAVRRLETENAEIRAEMEASKLSASESVTTCLEVAKREKKCLKKLLAWEKQKTKLQDEIAGEKEKIKELQRCLAIVEQAQKEAEYPYSIYPNLRFEQVMPSNTVITGKVEARSEGKEQTFAQVEEERRSREAAEANNKRKLEALRLKTEIDFQRHKDDLQRLEQEFSRLKLSAEFTDLNHQLNILPLGKPEKTKPQGETIARLLHELDTLEDSQDKGSNCDRECMICMKDEVSIVFLPCAHQVMCASCSDNHGKKGKATCPCCRIPIEQRIRVFGASS
ncbi:hypothetical protein GH714_041666 [Hevea brasiliensis]|uniref:RING-type domain-containing protein n=1 Tax=Hevea brasiliensis TaxID=3981 RepID=A0A6A6MUR3_HEVBR|nr:hypothetical protein GH714_041666 [Hevea brasiliensis]